jgi:hypothetical protein
MILVDLINLWACLDIGGVIGMIVMMIVVNVQGLLEILLSININRRYGQG